MNKFKARECPACQEGTIDMRNIRGLAVPFRDEPAVVIDEDLIVPRCDNCGEILLNEKLAAAYDAVAQQSYERQRITQQKEEIEKALSALRVNQSELETLLGVSQGYVSKLMRGEKVTSATTVRFLHVLSSDPPRAVRSLAEIASLDRELLSRLERAQPVRR